MKTMAINSSSRQRLKLAANKRYTYLLKRCTNTTLSILWIWIFAVSSMLALWAAGFVWHDARILGAKPPFAALTFPPWVWFCGITIPTGVALASAWFYRLQRKALRLIVYVPPVSEQIAAGAAGQTLVRGSCRPTITPEQMLRAAQSGDCVLAENLLRACQKPSDADLKEAD